MTSGTKLYVYVDETVFEDSDGTRFCGAGALVTSKAVGQEIIDAAMSELEADPDRYDPQTKRMDDATLAHGYFHASEDSKNARWPLASQIKANVAGVFRSSFQPAIGTSVEDNFRLQTMLSLVTPVWGSLPVDLVFEQRGGFGEDAAADLLEQLRCGQDRMAYESWGLRTSYLPLNVRIASKTEPGLQVADLLLWASMNERFFPGKRKSEVMSWLNCRSRSHASIEGSPVVWNIHTLNRVDQVVAAAEGEPAGTYPSWIDYSDVETVGREKELTALYCMAERTIHKFAAQDLPEHARHLEADLVETSQFLKSTARVSPAVVQRVARQFLRLFDTLPLYEGLADDDPRWAHLIRAKRIMGLTLHAELVDGVRLRTLFACVRDEIAESRPEDLGLK